MRHAEEARGAQVRIAANLARNWIDWSFSDNSHAGAVVAVSAGGIQQDQERAEASLSNPSSVTRTSRPWRRRLPIRSGTGPSMARCFASNSPCPATITASEASNGLGADIRSAVLCCRLPPLWICSIDAGKRPQPWNRLSWSRRQWQSLSGSY
jgi:hypothetical protein